MGTGLTTLFLALQLLLFLHLSEGGRNRPAARKQYFYNCFPPWHQHCQTSGSAILRRRTGGKPVRRRPLPELDASAAAEDRFAHRAGDLQEWLSGGTFTLPRETDGDGSGNDRVAAMGPTLRRQILNRIAELKIRSQRPNNEEQ
ncbi:PREDICTED: uncharacterized protein LOC109484951 [Branchiostoma belcheri]|uniref:Uncharacterized protein LOC109484951 n=1 Tax=Branchiostoma belcheri TaxID=7741 RepID=A0A6P5A3E1_BRABE|nr:PREDICTED: uncharacterized protein LOC109484951 [Branchiostoma belcheri]